MGRGGVEPPTHGFSVPFSAYKSLYTKDLYAVFCVKNEVCKWSNSPLTSQ